MFDIGKLIGDMMLWTSVTEIPVFKVASCKWWEYVTYDTTVTKLMIYSIYQIKTNTINGRKTS